MILIVLLYAISGFTITLGKVLLAYASPLFFVGVRMLISGIALCAYAHMQNIRLQALGLKDWFLIGQFALLGVVIPAAGRAWALQYLPAVKIALLFNFAPFFSALLTYFFLKERLTLIQLLGLVIGFTGLIPLFLNGQPQSVKELVTHISYADVFVLMAVLSFSYSLLVMQQLVRHRQCSPLLANGLTMFFAGIFTFNASFWTESVWIKGNAFLFIQLLFLNIILSNVISAHLQAAILKRYSSTTMTVMSFLSPLFAALYGWILFNERPSVNVMIAGALVVTGLVLYFYRHVQIALKKESPLSTSC